MNNSLIYFSGNLPKTIRKHVNEWRNRFVEKYGEASCITLSLEEVSPSILEYELLTPSFFSEKRLIIISGVTGEGIGKEAEKRMKDSAQILSQTLPNIPSGTFILAFGLDHSSFAEVRSLFSGGIRKDFSLGSRTEMIHHVLSVLKGKITQEAAEILVDRVGENDFLRFENEIEKLSLSPTISKNIVENHVNEHVIASVFKLQDALFSLSIKQALSELKRVETSGTIRETYRTLLSQLRQAVYYWHLRGKDIPPVLAGNLLEMKTFPREKAEKVSASIRGTLEKFFFTLVTIDVEEKTGGLIGEGDDALIFALERAIFTLQRQ